MNGDKEKCCLKTSWPFFNFRKQTWNSQRFWFICRYRNTWNSAWCAYQVVVATVAASGPTIWTSTYGLEPVLCNRLRFEPPGWAQTVRMLTQCFT